MGDTTIKTLNDTDIATYHRRPGPSGGAPATDADTHVQSDTDTAPVTATDSDAVSDHDAGAS